MAVAPGGFFARLEAETPTRVWVNNPTLAEMDRALAQGAIGCTTNPSFGGGLLGRAPSEILPVVRRVVDEATPEGPVAMAGLVQLRLVAPLIDRFRPLFDRSGGHQGFVSVQGSPQLDHDSDAILAEAEHALRLGPNATPKIPATRAGLAAFDELVAAGSPTIVTEVFSLSQLIEACERYLDASHRAGPTAPPFFVSPITGIFGDHLKEVAATAGQSVERADLELAGIALARACIRVVGERHYPVTLLCGGARTTFDLLGLVGAPVHATINWATFAELLEGGPDFHRGISDALDPEGIARLEAAFIDVRRALSLDGLKIDEYEDFAPVRYFRANFMAGWQRMQDAVSAASGTLS